MPKKKIPDLPQRFADGSEFAVFANSNDTYTCRLSDINLAENLIRTENTLTPRPLKTRFNEIVNVKDHGARGNGYTDDTTFLRSAIAAGSGKMIFFPPGHYMISGTLTVDADTFIHGAGVTIEQTGRNTPIFKIGTLGKVSDRVTIQGLTLKGVGKNDTAQTDTIYSYTDGARAYGIWITGSSHINIFDCVLTGFRNAGIVAHNSSEVHIVRNKITGTRTDIGVPDILPQYQQYGIWFYSTSEASNSGGNIVISDNIISKTGTGIKMHAGFENTEISFNIISEDIGTDAMHLCPYNNMTIRDNLITALNDGIVLLYKESETIDTSTQRGNLLTPSDIFISNNRIINTGRHGISVDIYDRIHEAYFLTNVNIDENHIDKCGGDGIIMNSCRESSVSFNTIKNITGRGCVLQDSDGVIGGNIFKNVVSTVCKATTLPLHNYFIQDNCVVDCSNVAPNGFFDFYKPVLPAIWQHSQNYAVNSFVLNNDMVFRCVDQGTSLDDGFGPGTNTKGIRDNNVTWDYIGTSTELDTGHVHFLRNTVVTGLTALPQFSLYSGLHLKLSWQDNNLPATKIDGSGLYVYIISYIAAEKNNKHGGHLLGNYYSLAYITNAYGTPSRETIGEAVPTQGIWQISDRVWNTRPSVDTYMGWVCVSGGSPGTWSPFGYLGSRGTAANLNAPTPGENAIGEQVVIGTDTRLINNRTPLPHGSSHGRFSTDPINPSSIGALAVDSNLSEIADPQTAKTNLMIGTLANYDIPQGPQNGQVLSYNTTTNTFDWSWLTGTSTSNKYSELVGNASDTVFLITHNLSNLDVHVQVYTINSSTNERSPADCQIAIVDNNNVRLTFNTPPQQDQCRVVIIS